MEIQSISAFALVPVFAFLLASPTLAQRGCTGSPDCRVCKNCSSCRHCAKEHGTCGVCASGKSLTAPTTTRTGLRQSQGPSEQLSEHWRWAIKTGADKNASAVPTTPKDTTVEDLIALARPEVLARRPRYRQEQISRIDPVETTLYRIRAVIVGYKCEPDDDFHIVVEGAEPGKTMIVEIPDPTDVSAGSRWKSQIQTARSAFEKRFPAIGKRIKRTNVKAIITGVGFWDKKHGQTGVAPNAIELHPVIAIEFSK